MGSLLFILSLIVGINNPPDTVKVKKPIVIKQYVYRSDTTLSKAMEINISVMDSILNK